MDQIVGLLINLLALVSSALLGTFVASAIFAHTTGRKTMDVWRRFLLLLIGRR